MNLTAHSSAVLIPLQTTNQTASTNAPVRDREATRQFLHLLDPTARDFTFQTFAEPNSHNAGLARSTSDRAEVVRLYELGGAGVYVTINETDLTGRKRENIKRIRAIWQEDDDGHGGPCPLEPSVVVESSPQHFHRYWLTADGWPADEQGRADFAAVMERMVTSYGCDKNAKDLSRVLRVPGFLHRKDPARPHMVRIVEDNGRRYTREQILQAFPRVEREQTQRNEWRAADRDEERIADALRAIPADDRDVWLQIGMALKDELGDGGRSIWDNWSSTCREKFKDRDQERTWRSFRRNGIGIGTLFWHAQRHGWLPPRREPPRDKTTGNGAARSNASPDTNRAAVLVRADELNPEAINWAWKNRFAFGKLAVLAGDPGLGKSTMLVEIAALHSIGGEFPCGEGRAQQCESLILTAEDGLRDTLIPRLIAAGADLSKIHFLTGTKAEGSDDESLFDLGRDIPALRRKMSKMPR
jgi:hypothetical protein